jgi:hypothetical protein
MRETLGAVEAGAGREMDGGGREGGSEGSALVGGPARGDKIAGKVEPTDAFLGGVASAAFTVPEGPTSVTTRRIGAL